MNKRIEQLAKQAGAEIKTLQDGTEYRSLYQEDGAGFDLAKFAELIVKECVTTIKQDRFGKSTDLETEYDDGYVDGMGYAEHLLKEHFGVE